MNETEKTKDIISRLMPPRKIAEAELSEKKPEIINKKPDLVKNIVILLSLSFIVSLGIFLFIYIRSVYSPDAILGKAIGKFIENPKTKYESDIKFYFSSKENNNTSLEGLSPDLYQVLRRSSVETYNIKISGDIDRSGDKPKGKYELTWSSSGQKMFGFEGYFQGYDLFYKVNYSYQEVLENVQDGYSKVNISDLFSKTVFNDPSPKTFDLDALKFKVKEVYPDDIISDIRANHFKVEVTDPIFISKIIPSSELTDFDVWISKKNHYLLRLKGRFEITDVGMEGNSMIIDFDTRFLLS